MDQFDYVMYGKAPGLGLAQHVLNALGDLIQVYKKDVSKEDNLSAGAFESPFTLKPENGSSEPCKVVWASYGGLLMKLRGHGWG